MEGNLTKYEFRGNPDSVSAVVEAGRVVVVVDETVQVDQGPVSAINPAPTPKTEIDPGKARPGESEIGVFARVMPHLIYKEGVGLVDRETGEPFTRPDVEAPFPTDWGTGTIDEQVGRLLQWQIEHPLYHSQLNIDGNDIGQPGDLPKTYLGTAGGQLRLRTDTPAPPPVVALSPTYTPPPLPTGEPATQTVDLGTFGDARTAFRGFSHGARGCDSVEFKLRIGTYGGSPNAQHRVRWAEFGGPPQARGYAASVNGRMLVDTKNELGPSDNSVSFLIGVPTEDIGVDFGLRVGDELSILVVGHGPVTEGGDMLCEVNLNVA